MNFGRSRIKLLDTWIDNVDISEAGRRIDDFIRLGHPQQVVTANLDFLRLSEADTSFRNLINTAGLVVADGMPLVWASRLLGDALPARVAGVDLVTECARLAAERGYRVFMLGAGPGVADSAAAVLRERFPGLCIAGTYSPPSLTPAETKITLGLIRSAAPDILLVAFGAPIQEQWIRANMHAMGVPVCIGVGGSFDLLSGRINRAPDWMQHGGMEWFYRFTREPGRLWKRYFVHDLPVFLRLMAGSTLTAMPGRAPAAIPHLPNPHVPLAFEARSIQMAPAREDRPAIEALHG